jgi:hypothetical protein
VRNATLDDEELVRSLARLERLSGVLWIVLGVLQILGVVTAIAGGWNIYAATQRFKIARAIEARLPGVPAAFEPTGSLITMGFVNVVLGGAIGVVLVGLDVWIRKRVLESAELFAPGYVRISEEPAAELPKTYGQQVAGGAEPEAPPAPCPSRHAVRP